MSMCSDFRSGNAGAFLRSVVLVRSDHGDDLAEIERSFDSKGPPERLASGGELQAPGRGMQMSTTPRHRPTLIGLDDPCRRDPDGDESHQVGFVRSGSTSETRANGHLRVYPLTGEAAPRDPASGASVSERMSMRQPVSLAASRAFCPSLPMARESWKSGTTTRAARAWTSTSVTERTCEGESAWPMKAAGSSL